jgi:hypothetical protein
MTFALSLFALAAASCGLDGKFDPDGDICKLSDDKWGNMDADSVPATATHKMSLTIHEKDAHTDIFEFDHSGTTPGSLSAKVSERYILSCPQPAGTETDAAGEKVPNKAVQFTVHRPADMTEFGSEWVQLFRKDSWENITNEYEPWTMNKYGAKIPLNRNTPDGDPPVPDKEDSVSVYMEVSDIGDYEVKYGNPQIKTTAHTDGTDPDGRWVAVEFKSTLLRVGSPWAECETDPEVLEENKVDIGTIIPAFFGHPNLNKEAYEEFILEVIAGKSSVSDTSRVRDLRRRDHDQDSGLVHHERGEGRPPSRHSEDRARQREGLHLLLRGRECLPREPPSLRSELLRAGHVRGAHQAAAGRGP